MSRLSVMADDPQYPTDVLQYTALCAVNVSNYSQNVSDDLEWNDDRQAQLDQIFFPDFPKLMRMDNPNRVDNTLSGGLASCRNVVFDKTLNSDLERFGMTTVSAHLGTLWSCLCLRSDSAGS